MLARRVSLLGVGIVVSVTGLAGPAGAGGGGGCFEPLSSARTKVVQTQGWCFVPSIARIDPGESITFANPDSEFDEHTVAGANGSWWMKRTLRPGTSVEVRFEDPGVYSYYCPYHIGMIGSIVVGRATSDANVENTNVDVARLEALPSPEPLIFRMPGAVTREAADPISSAFLVWGGGALGLLGGLAVYWVERRRRA